MHLKPIIAAPSRRALRIPSILPLGLLVLTVFVTTPALAGFRYVAPSAAAPQPTPFGASVGQTAAPSSLLPGGAAPMSATTDANVQGFADSVPLTVALRQILPRGMAFRIAQPVEPSTKVSWNGGRPWQQVLDDMLAGAGLQASYSQNAVLVQKGALAIGGEAAAMPTMVPPLPAVSPAASPAVMAPMNSMAPLDVPATPPVAFQGNQSNDAPPTLLEPQVAAAAPPPVPQQMPQPASQTAPEPYVAPASTGAASMVPDSNVTLGGMQSPPPAAPGSMLPQQQPIVGTAGEAPAQPVPGTELGPIPAIESGALNAPLPGPNDVAPMPAAPGEVAQAWQAHSGQTLHEVLKDWAQRAGVELNWVSEYDYPIQASITFSGTFEEAVRTLLGGFANASPQPIGRLHRNEQLGQQALVIEMRGNTYDE